jgi:hypothetical protein
VQKVSIILVLPRFWHRQVNRREAIPAGVPVDTGMFWEPVWASRRRFRFLGPAGRLFNCKPSRPLPAHKGKGEEEKYRAGYRVIVPKNEAVYYTYYLPINHRLDGLDDLYDYFWMQYFAGVERDYHSSSLRYILWLPLVLIRVKPAASK